MLVVRFLFYFLQKEFQPRKLRIGYKFYTTIQLIGHEQRRDNIAIIKTNMRYELFSQSTEICRKLSSQSWAKALDFAQFYGWQPMGTRPPSIYDFQSLNADWSGTYLTNDGQIVKTEDAKSLAYALQKSLDDIPDVNIEVDWDAKHLFEDDTP